MKSGVAWGAGSPEGRDSGQPALRPPSRDREDIQTGHKVVRKILNFINTNGQTYGKFLLICLAAYGKNADNFMVRIRPFKNACRFRILQCRMDCIGSRAVFDQKLWITSLQFSSYLYPCLIIIEHSFKVYQVEVKNLTCFCMDEKIPVPDSAKCAGADRSQI